MLKLPGNLKHAKSVQCLPIEKVQMMSVFGHSWVGSHWEHIPMFFLMVLLLQNQASGWTFSHLGQVKSMSIALFTYQAFSPGPSSMGSGAIRGQSSTWHKSCRSLSHFDASLGKGYLFFHRIVLGSSQNKPCDLSLLLINTQKVQPCAIPQGGIHHGSMEWAGMGPVACPQLQRHSCPQSPCGSRNLGRGRAQHNQCSCRNLPIWASGQCSTWQCLSHKVPRISVTHWIRHITCQTGRVQKKGYPHRSLPYTQTALIKANLLPLNNH